MTTQNLFRAARVKLDRAQHHLSKIKGIVADYIESEPMTQTITLLDQSAGRIEGTTTFKEVPESLSPVIGDFVHNLRASLDLLATDLVRAAKKSPSDVYFPFSRRKEDIDVVIKNRNFDRAGPAAVELLKTFEPYPNGKTALRAIHDLDICDKHQQLIPSPMYRGTLFSVDTKTGQITPNQNSKDGIELVFGKDVPFAEQPLLPTLQNLMELTESVVEAFVALHASQSKN